MKRFRAPLFALLLLGFGATPGMAFDLTVLHTNDVHAMYGGTTAKGAPCYSALCEGGTGGSVRLKQAVDTLRASDPNVLLLDAGDEFQGTLFYNTFKGEVASGVLDRIGYDAFTPGNHEFDDGCGEFRRFVERMRVPVLAANLSLPSASDGRSLTRPWIIVERQGRRIGIVGLVNEETPALSSPCGEAVFGSAEAALRKAVAELRERGVNVIVALTHLGLDVDGELAGRVDGVDVFVGGHTHSLLSNTSPKAVGAYPVVRKSPSGEPVLVVTASSSCRLLGRLQVAFDDAGVAQTWTGEPVALDGKHVSAAPDRELMAFLDGYAGQLKARISQPVGKILPPASSPSLSWLEEDVHECRVRECMSGNIVADALLREAKPLGATIALYMGGGVRASLPVGVVTVGNLLETLPFDNTLVVGELTGKQLREALEHGASGYEKGAGRFVQAAGLSYAVAPSRPVGSRIGTVSVRGASGGWEPLRPEAVYRVATVDYIAEGGDGYTAFKPLKWQYTGRSQSDILRGHIAAAPVQAGLEGRIRVER